MTYFSDITIVRLTGTILEVMSDLELLHFLLHGQHPLRLGSAAQQAASGSLFV